ncbi:MAG: helix-turn-helix domain-containing protein [Nanoarchaeota archaeon]
MGELEVFEELGLASNEAKVYEVLVQFGKLSAAEVSAKSGVSYSRIYNVLEALLARGLIVVVPEKTKKFAPADPAVFEKLITEKEKKLMVAREKMKEMQKFYDVKEKQPVVVGVGKAGFHKLIGEMKDYEQYDYTLKWNVDAREDWMRNLEKSLNKKIEVKTLARYDKETEKNVQQWLTIHKDIKAFPNEGVAMSILDDEEVMIGLIKSNVTLLIRDKPFAKIMKRFFAAAYDEAKEIPKIEKRK